MKMVAWNVRGLNDPVKTKETKVFLQQHGVDFCALFETRVRDHKLQMFRRSLVMPGAGRITMGFLLGVGFGLPGSQV